MFVLYNILQLLLLAVFFPFLTLFVLCSPKYRNRTPARLSVGLTRTLSAPGFSGKTIWLHALSVGEVTSAVPLVTGLRKSYPDSRIVVSVTTRTGRQVADRLLLKLADHIIDGPLDILPVVSRFVKQIHPSLFILVETDFWPNILLHMHHKNIPTILVNGRVSQKAMAGYRRLRFFFHPIFQSFSFLCMQTQHDRNNMQDLGLSPEKLRTLGNLKFDTAADKNNPASLASDGFLPKDRIILICGSTHPGEEEIVMDCYLKVRTNNPELFLIIAPRDTSRAAEIRSLAAARGLSVILRSDMRATVADIFILDTIGELIDFYARSDIGFVGGSLVNRGGHNPIEPAAMALPVVFGPNMQDFSEIADALIDTGGASQVSGPDELTECLSRLLISPEQRSRQGLAAQQCVAGQRGVIDKHLHLIQQLL